jgi:hypothetical protein
MFRQLKARPRAARAAQPLPGWFARRRRDRRAASAVLSGIPSGVVVPEPARRELSQPA